MKRWKEEPIGLAIGSRIDRVRKGCHSLLSQRFLFQAPLRAEKRNLDCTFCDETRCSLGPDVITNLSSM